MTAEAKLPRGCIFVSAAMIPAVPERRGIANQRRLLHDYAPEAGLAGRGGICR